ncbi:MAG: endolytic transglycosylase MltG [Bacteroidetes bacterium]|nr:endolytic transglycosylase MltG [Bacteroidota bacterium]
MKKFLKITIPIILVLACAGAWYFWRIYYRPVVHTPEKKAEYILIHTGSTMNDLLNELFTLKIIDDTSTFHTITNLKKFYSPKPGRYRITDGMSNRDLVDLLRSGKQEPVTFTFNNIRTKEQLASRVGGKLEADSAKFLFLINDPGFLSKYGLTPETIMTLFIPNSYQLYWNTTEEQFVDRMATEYKKFWTDERKAKAAALGLSQSEVVTLASIVESEQTQYPDERPTIAGLYINRLRQKIPLQSDPTIIYALGDFNIKRVLDTDLKIDSPYNTYKYAGLPPGPIRIPETASIDAVLNYVKSDYIYMCADFGTGHHRFTNDYNVHLKNAHDYQDALNKANIKR